MTIPVAGFPELLEALGFNGVDEVSVRWQRTSADRFDGGWAPTLEAPALAAQHPEENVWFSINKARRRDKGRVANTDVTRLTCLYADLDVKPRGLENIQMALDVIDDLSGMLGTRPVAIILSGHGLQPLWAVDPEDPDAAVTDDNRGYVVALMRRFGRLLRHTAEVRGGRVDSVFDLSRVLRVPGTVNWKDRDHPVWVDVRFEAGRPLTIAEVDERLTEYNAVEQAGDREEIGTVLSHVGGWLWAAETAPWVTRAVRSWARAEPTGRHPWLIGVATSLAIAHRLGWVTEADHQQAVEDITRRFHELIAVAGQARATQRGELSDAFAFGQAKAQSQTEATAQADWAFWVQEERLATGAREVYPDADGGAGSIPAAAGTEPRLPSPGPTVVDGELWGAREVLTHIYCFARARQCSPLAVLGIVLARVVAAIPASVVLPPQVGSIASINLFVGLIGKSGAGKGAAEACAADAVDVGYINIDTPGSGEGIAHAYMKRVKGSPVPEMHTTAVMFSVAEIDTLAALRDRNGSTLMPELRKAWMGERLGFAYADPAKRLPVPAHKYRMTLVAGIQPGRAGTLLDDADGGTPQRFLWLPVTDSDAPEYPPQEPPQWPWRRPLLYADGQGKVVIPVCVQAQETVRMDRLVKLRGAGDDLDAHAVMARLKIAVALALLEQRIEVSDDDWRISGMVMAISDRTRASVVEHLRRSASEANRQKGVAEGTRAIVVAETVEEAAIKRVARWIIRKLTVTEWMTEGELRRAMPGRDRQHLNTALERLVETGVAEAEDVVGGGTQGTRYRLVTS